MPCLYLPRNHDSGFLVPASVSHRPLRATTHDQSLSSLLCLTIIHTSISDYVNRPRRFGDVITKRHSLSVGNANLVVESSQPPALWRWWQTHEGRFPLADRTNHRAASLRFGHLLLVAIMPSVCLVSGCLPAPEYPWICVAFESGTFQHWSLRSDADPEQ
ncbi:hypothetical protein CC79DRAFT_826150 [Sarocladium strictum]